jgi:hypothetical protein
MKRFLSAGIITGVLVLASLPAAALADDHHVTPGPGSGQPLTASQFATQYSGCLGPLRSLIANGTLAGAVLPSGFVVPDGFSGSFNPGGHYGTVGEAYFLEVIGGIPADQLSAFCAKFK